MARNQVPSHTTCFTDPNTGLTHKRGWLVREHGSMMLIHSCHLAMITVLISLSSSLKKIMQSKSDVQFEFKFKSVYSKKLHLFIPMNISSNLCFAICIAHFLNPQKPHTEPESVASALQKAVGYMDQHMIALNDIIRSNTGELEKYTNTEVPHDKTVFLYLHNNHYFMIKNLHLCIGTPYTYMQHALNHGAVSFSKYYLDGFYIDGMIKKAFKLAEDSLMTRLTFWNMLMDSIPSYSENVAGTSIPILSGYKVFLRFVGCVQNNRTRHCHVCTLMRKEPFMGVESASSCYKLLEKETLFCDYVKTFLQFKQESSEFPKDVVTDADKESYVRDYFEKEGIKLNLDKIELNPACSSIMKSILNSLCLHEGLPTTEIVEDPEQHCYYCSVVLCKWESCPTRDINVFLGAFTTAHARLELYDVMDRFGDRLLHCDTDRLNATSKDGKYEPSLGPYVGDITDEVGHCFCQLAQKVMGTLQLRVSHHTRFTDWACRSLCNGNGTIVDIFLHTMTLLWEKKGFDITQQVICKEIQGCVRQIHKHLRFTTDETVKRAVQTKVCDLISNSSESEEGIGLTVESDETQLLGAWYTPKKNTPATGVLEECLRNVRKRLRKLKQPGQMEPQEDRTTLAPEDAHPLATYPTDDTTDTPRLHDSITYKVPQIQPIVNKPAAAPAPRQHSTTEETTPSTGDWKNLPHTR
ncbi:Mannan endo-1,4-beta-mannosidase [Labeo rohita]|uniref:Mannan endo-1,4-beta-mannosidase n=1 Tax=Labeo rohita TaxID=84645 RepID=A0ABQ8L4Q1_LABRO|nr:Mannan endo-1,4-beta-mannosidase [Labeo rohita]